VNEHGYYHSGNNPGSPSCKGTPAGGSFLSMRMTGRLCGMHRLHNGRDTFLPQKQIILVVLISIVFVFISGCVGDHQDIDKKQIIATTVSSSALPVVSATTIPVRENNPGNTFLQQSEKTVRKFANISDRNLTFDGITNVSNTDFYVFKSGNSSFWVNNVTGRVQSASWGEAGSKKQKEIIDLDEGLTIAESYAKEKYPELWNISDKKGVRLQVKRINDGGLDRVFEYSWQEVLYNPNKNTTSQSEIPGMNTVFIGISPYTGHITHYHEFYKHDEALTELTSNLTEEQARMYAVLYFESTGMSEVRQDELVSSGLHVVIDHDHNQRLSWGFALTRKIHGIDIGGVVGIDAHNGSVIWHASMD
jgi:hypothetical protein